MEQTMTATHARIHFGEVLRKVAKGEHRIIVERAGRPQAVILSITEYQQLKTATESARWKELVDQARGKIGSELGNRELPPPDVIVRQMREERDEQLVDMR